MKFTSPVLISALLAASPSVSAAIDIHFDYRYDTGFFTGANSYRQDILNAAAATFESRLEDSLSAVLSSDSSSFDAIFFRPDSGVLETLREFSVAENQIVVFTGARAIAGSAIATGGPGGVGIHTTSPVFRDDVLSRGQTGALGPIAGRTDFGPWGGSLAFDSTVNWYFDSDPATDETFSGFDLFSVAVHELGHILGFGTADSYGNLVSNGVFTGAAATALLGNPPPLAGDNDHWRDGLSYLGQEVALDPTIAAGQRKRFTELDFAALQDIGWEVSPIPEADTWAMMLAGLGLLGWRLRASSRRAA